MGKGSESRKSKKNSQQIENGEENAPETMNVSRKSTDIDSTGKVSSQADQTNNNDFNFRKIIYLFVYGFSLIPMKFYGGVSHLARNPEDIGTVQSHKKRFSDLLSSFVERHVILRITWMVIRYFFYYLLLVTKMVIKWTFYLLCSYYSLRVVWPLSCIAFKMILEVIPILERYNESMGTTTEKMQDIVSNRW